MKRHVPVHVNFYFPKDETGKHELSKRVAQIHADAVTMRIKNLRCPTEQKLRLLDTVIKTVKEGSRERT